MEFILNNLLTLILFTPVLAALVVMLVPREQESLIRWTSFVLSFIPLILSLVLWFNFDQSQAGFQFEEKVVWYSTLNSSYHLGVDGVSLTMVLLTTLLTPLAILASFTIKERVKAYMVLFFLLAGAALHVETLVHAGALTFAYIALRILGRIAGTRLGGRISGADALTRRWMGLALLPQAGVAIGMALVAAQRFPEIADLVLPVVLGSTVVFELLGPVVTRWALAEVGDIGDQGRERKRL